jgi:release factor glutamine methyltransferase
MFVVLGNTLMLNFLKNKNRYIENLSTLYDRDHALRVLGWIVEKVLSKPLSYLMVHPEYCTPEHEHKIEQFVEQLVHKKYPLQYILGTVSFGPLELEIEPPVLIPRPETEEWVLHVIHSLQQYKNEPLKILDMCTGSGCIALTLASFFKNAHIDAVDLYDKPLGLTQKNAQKNGLTNVTTIKSDLFTNLTGKEYDLILSNPPYIDEEVWQTLSHNVKEWEDKNALVADNKGLALYERIVPNLQRFLKKDSVIKNDARVYLEIGYDQGEKVKVLLEQSGFVSVTVHKDFAGHDRLVTGKSAV